jgi:TolB-like protein
VRVRVPLTVLAATCGLAVPAIAAPVRVALLPVAVHSSDAGSGYLSAGLASMLSSRLEQFDEIAVIRLDDAKAVGAQPAAAIAAGREAGADFVVFGSFTQFGAGASLDLQCAHTAAGSDPGGPRRMFVQSGALGDIIPKLDDVAGKIHLYVTGAQGEAASAPAAPGASGWASLADLTHRVELLERTVFRSGPEEGPAQPPAPKQPKR